jgi:CheY-like chemotaxis protein
MSNVLVVDDSATQSTLVSALLRPTGVSLHTARDGAEALRVLGEVPIDLVVTDMQMPAMNGLALIREMRSTNPLVPAVLMTAYGHEDLAADALGTGAVTYIAKEHLDALLAETVERLLAFARVNAESLNLKGALEPTRLQFAVDCAFDRLMPLVCLQLRLLTAMNVLHTRDRIRMAEAMHYLLFHSVLHGNLEQPLRSEPFSLEQANKVWEDRAAEESTRDFGQRCLSMRFDVSPRRLRYGIRREGSGPSIRHGPLPGTPESFADERCRGMLLLTSVMDEVFIDSAGDDITLVKHLGQ